MTLGQLGWDGAVAPINELTWQNVLDTAKRFRGLEVNSDFFVVYKDEDGDVINVKNEEDLKEAIRWAEDQRVPCLCLNVPFASGDSETDSEWIELDQDSPRVNARSPQQLDSDLQLNGHDEHDEDVSVPAEPEEQVPETENQYPDQTIEAHHEDERENIQEAEQDQNENIQEAEQDQNEDDEVQHEEDEAQHEKNVEQKPADNEHVFEHEESVEVEDDELTQHEESSTSAAEELDLGAIIEAVVSVNNNKMPVNKALLLELLSDSVAVQELSLLLQHPSVQHSVVTVAESERQYPGSALKSTTAQLLKLLYKQPEIRTILSRIPNVLEILPEALSLLQQKDEDKETLELQVHSNVCCDGCESDEDLARASTEAGYRTDKGELAGIRYKSAVIPNFDLCESCERDGRYQKDKGPFLKIIDPATAPELILCALPGASAGISQLEKLDWRNPMAAEFFEFVQAKRQRAFPQPRQAPAVVPPLVCPSAPPAPLPVVPPAEVHPSTEAPAKVEPPLPVETPAMRKNCMHLLKTFETGHSNFTCDYCKKKMPTKSVMYGCRQCNFDVCQSCHPSSGLPLEPIPAPAPSQVPETAVVHAPPQAKFVSDITLADGCVVRPGERLNKTWRVRNSGTERWLPGTRIGHVGGDSFGGPVEGVEVPLAAPGEAVNITVPLVMPSQPGRYTSYWRMMTPHPHNAKFGHRFWVTVNVIPAAPPAVPSIFEPNRFNGTILRAPDVTLPVVRPPPPPPAPRPVVEEPVVRPEFETAVAQITEFGFSDIDKIVKILNEVNGDTGAAIDRLLEESN